MLEPVKIPQNVYVEDRIVGPITLKQLIIVGIGVGFSYALYSIAAKAGVVTIPLTIALWTPAVIAAGFAFVKINDLSLFNIILLMIEAMNKPAQRTWSPSPGISINIVTRAPQEAVDASKKLAENTAKLAEVTRQLEHREKELSRIANAPVVSPALPNTEADAEEDVHVTEMHADDEKPVLPVNTNRVQAQGLDPARSVDGLHDLGKFQSIFRRPTA